MKEIKQLKANWWDEVTLYYVAFYQIGSDVIKVHSEQRYRGRSLTAEIFSPALNKWEYFMDNPTVTDDKHILEVIERQLLEDIRIILGAAKEPNNAEFD